MSRLSVQFWPTDYHRAAANHAAQIAGLMSAIVKNIERGEGKTTADIAVLNALCDDAITAATAIIAELQVDVDLYV